MFCWNWLAVGCSFETTGSGWDIGDASGRDACGGAETTGIWGNWGPAGPVLEESNGINIGGAAFDSAGFTSAAAAEGVKFCCGGW